MKVCLCCGSANDDSLALCAQCGQPLRVEESLDFPKKDNREVI